VLSAKKVQEKMKRILCKCPICEYDSLLDTNIFSSTDADLLPKTRYLQAYVKYSKIVKLAEAKEYKGRWGNSGRIRDLMKDCLNDMQMALETKYGKRFLRDRTRNPSWDNWMHEVAEIRNQAIHKMTVFRIEAGTGKYYLRAEMNGRTTETSKEALPYLKEALEKIKVQLGITEI
jgi:hypothetical protein